MRDDGIKAIAISDDIIRREAVLQMSAISRKEDQKHDDISGKPGNKNTWSYHYAGSKNIAKCDSGQLIFTI